VVSIIEWAEKGDCLSRRGGGGAQVKKFVLSPFPSKEKKRNLHCLELMREGGRREDNPRGKGFSISSCYEERGGGMLRLSTATCKGGGEKTKTDEKEEFVSLLNSQKKEKRGDRSPSFRKREREGKSKEGNDKLVVLLQLAAKGKEKGEEKDALTSFPASRGGGKREGEKKQQKKKKKKKNERKRQHRGSDEEGGGGGLVLFPGEGGSSKRDEVDCSASSTIPPGMGEGGTARRLPVSLIGMEKETHSGVA